MTIYVGPQVSFLLGDDLASFLLTLLCSERNAYKKPLKN